MKKTIFATAIIASLIAGCASSSSISVLERKEPARPFSKVLLIYVDEGCDFTVFDSTSYNICMRSRFLDPENQEIRKRVETQIVQDLASTNTTVLKSSDWLNTRTNSFEDFRKIVESKGVDALLLIDFQTREHSERQSPALGSYQNGQYVPGRSLSYKTASAAYQCFLLNPKNPNTPIFKAEIGLNGKAGTGKNGLNRTMARQLADVLKANGYIAH